MPSAGGSEMPVWADGARGRTALHLSAAEQAVPGCDIGSRKDNSTKTRSFALSLLSPGFSQREDCARAETFDKFEPFIRVVDQLLPQAELQPLVHNAGTSK